MKATTLTAVGDICFGDHPVCVGYGFNSRFRRYGEAEPGYPFVKVKDALAKAELRFANLESVLSYTNVDWNRLESSELRGHPATAKRLAFAGFNVVNVANNHILQHGADAFRETVDGVRSLGIGVVGLADRSGSACVPMVIESNGLSLGFLGYAMERESHFEGTPLYVYGPACDIEGDVRRLKSQVDIVVCSMHWGLEFCRFPSLDEVSLGRRIIDAGAHAVLGHHPHVYRGVERYRGGVIGYSLGNFVCDMLWDRHLRTGVILTLEMDADRVLDVRVQFTETSDDYEPVPVDSRTATALERDWHELCELVQQTPPVAEYVKEIDRLGRRNRYRSYGYLLRNVERYPRPILRQIVMRSLGRKLRPRAS